MRLPSGIHLTYCSNVHPGEHLAQVRDNLSRYTVPLKARLAPDAPMGVGLRLSDLASRELLEGTQLAELRAWLDNEGLYVFTLNGFPFGAFHGTQVKAEVFAPDWRDARRAAFTMRLAAILAALLPDGMTGGISTVPLSYRAWVHDKPEATDQMARRLADVTLALSRLELQQGACLHVDLEPEPGGALDATQDVVSFFHNHLLEAGAEHLTRSAGVSAAMAQDLLLRHIRVCYDACHQAVMYESPGLSLEQLERAGIRVGKLQASTALKVAMPPDMREREALIERLTPFAEQTYLHQVVARHKDGSRFYGDLPLALADAYDPEVLEWRVHFHVPIFSSNYGGLGSTRDELAELLALLPQRRFTEHVEIETYTWDVLPEKPGELLDAIEAEFRWVLAQYTTTRVPSAWR